MRSERKEAFAGKNCLMSMQNRGKRTCTDGLVIVPDDTQG